MTKAPGKAFRAGISIVELMDLFPTEDAAREWFEAIYWPDGVRCGHCGGARVRPVASGKPMPHWCSDCRKYFSVKTGTVMEGSNLPLRKWAIGIYLCLTSLKSISSMKLHRDLKIGQKAAWFMLHRLREAWAENGGDPLLGGPVEADETYVGGRRANMSNKKRKELREAGAGRGAVGKAAVVGVKDRETNQVAARHVPQTDAATLQGFVREHAEAGATLYTDEAAAYVGLGRDFDHETVNHSASEYVRGEVHIQGMEALWSMFKRAHKGTFHKISPKHLNRYVQEFAGKHNIRNADTLAQMTLMVLALSGRRLRYRDLIADNGLPSGARS